MKKIILLVAAVFLLGACEEDKVEVIEKEYLVEDVQLIKDTDAVQKVLMGSNENDKVKIGTETETFVVYLKNTKFLKTENEVSSVSIKKITNSLGTRQEAELLLNASDVKMSSKQYADLYNSTLTFDQ